eukprot:CAMPEP_0176124190 /NCGR_PEP_ID=MMETSP0120_2-20121206/62607_1 /TAXON_ID=160619 /ORGANISM="Kryptoperidinium foliaceum, Strain CCMP 1326" /LENGTH=43 /DNA_ID= /DNA_START= /DNA_END= /DNA_ORIENTATION=
MEVGVVSSSGRDEVDHLKAGEARGEAAEDDRPILAEGVEMDRR